MLSGPPDSELPDFFDPSTWDQPQFKSLPFDKTTWSEMLVDIMNHPKFAECSQKNPGYFDKLKDCPQCYETADEFIQRLCAEEHPCDCDEPPPEEPEGPAKPQGPEEPGGTEEPEEEGKKSNFLTYALIGTGVVGIIALGSVMASDR